MEELAKKLPQGRQGQALVWRQKNVTIEKKPENLFVHDQVDRQDLTGEYYSSNFKKLKI